MFCGNKFCGIKFCGDKSSDDMFCMGSVKLTPIGTLKTCDC